MVGTVRVTVTASPSTISLDRYSCSSVPIASAWNCLYASLSFSRRYDAASRGSSTWTSNATIAREARSRRTRPRHGTLRLARPRLPTPLPFLGETFGFFETL